MEYEQFARLSRVALGEAPADLVLKNADVINVFSGELLRADVAICDGIIAGVGSYNGLEEHDLSGKILSPGLIDSHLHFESTLVTPPELIANAVAFGTTTYIADPHESANVCGLTGINYILAQTEDVPANVYLMMPSCVPSAAFEDNGGKLTAAHMATLAQHPRVLGLGEVMDYRSVITAQREMYDKLELFRSKNLDGHAPFLAENELTAYALAGISTDHECCSYEYAMQERRRGMQVLIREGSAAKNLEAIVTGIVKNGIDTTGFCFCSDDKHIEEIRREGHISHCVKKAIALGISPIDAIKMATINAARQYSLRHLGAIAPGKQADILVLNDLNEMKLDSVYYKGVIVSKNEQPAAVVVPACGTAVRESINMAPFKENCLELHTGTAKTPVMCLVDGQIVTTRADEVLPEKNGYFTPNEVYNKIAVFERHKANGNIGVGVIKGFGMRGGAIATSVSHDCHNIVAAGDNDEDILIAVRELIKTQGGYVIAGGGEVLASLPLPIMGLMSDIGYEKVNATLHDMVSMAHKMGLNPNIDPFITLSFTALPVIPALRLTTKGLYDVIEERFV